MITVHRHLKANQKRYTPENYFVKSWLLRLGEYIVNNIYLRTPKNYFLEKKTRING